MKILLTNDDSYDSPLFHILYDALKSKGYDLTCVMPDSEQSWKGKSMTRDGLLIQKSKSIEGRCFTTFSGTPADCVNFGLYNMLKNNKPDLVISGINMGYNTGLSYILSSGTIGAAMEGYLAGVPSFAISQKLAAADYKYWSSERKFSPVMIERYSSIFTSAFDKIMGKIEYYLEESKLWSIELPDYLAEDWQLQETVPSMNHYGQVFAETDAGKFKHASPSISKEDHQNSDVSVMMSGNVAINELDFRALFQK